MKNIIQTAVIAAALLAVNTAVQATDVEGIYSSKCQACHATGAANAPKVGDKEAWAPRIAAGMDAMMANVINGKVAMPPKGTCMDCSDDDLKAVVEHMVSQSQ